MNWYEKRLDELDQQQWELLCDRCGRCCVHKLIDDDTEELFFTNVACRLYDSEQGCCSDYSNRLLKVDSCIEISLDAPEVFQWLPSTCAYRLRYENKPLPDWHPVISEDNNAMIDAGVLIASSVVSETEINLDELQQYLVAWS